MSFLKYSKHKIGPTCTGTCVRTNFRQFVVSFKKFQKYVLFYQEPEPEPEPPQNRSAPKPCSQNYVNFKCELLFSVFATQKEPCLTNYRMCIFFVFCFVSLLTCPSLASLHPAINICLLTEHPLVIVFFP